MTIKERIDEAVNKANYNTDSLNKLIALAYYYGAETTAKIICNEHNKRAKEAVDRARSARYWRQAINIIGDLADGIYDYNYAQDMTDTFGDDETNL